MALPALAFCPKGQFTVRIPLFRFRIHKPAVGQSPQAVELNAACCCRRTRLVVARVIKIEQVMRGKLIQGGERASTAPDESDSVICGRPAQWESLFPHGARREPHLKRGAYGVSPRQGSPLRGLLRHQRLNTIRCIMRNLVHFRRNWIVLECVIDIFGQPRRFSHQPCVHGGSVENERHPAM